MIALLATASAALGTECAEDSATAFTEPAETVAVSAGEPGILARMLVEPGDLVAAGETLAELDSTMAAADVRTAQVRAEAEGAISVAEARLGQAQQRLDEISKLQGTGALRPLELLGAKSDLEVAKAQLDQAHDDQRSAQALLAAARARLDRLSIRSPIDGIVDEVHRRPGELVGAAGDARLATVIRIDTLTADFFAPADCLSGVEAGDAVRVFLVREQRELPARVKDLGRSIDAPTGLQLIGIELANPQFAVLGGERIELRLPLLPVAP